MTYNSDTLNLIHQTYDWLSYVIKAYNNYIEDIMEYEDGEIIARGMENFIKIDKANEEEIIKCILTKMQKYLHIFNVKPLEIDNIKVFYFFGLCAFEILKTPHTLIWAIKEILLEIEENCNTNNLLQNIMIDKIIEILKNHENNADTFKNLYGEYGVYTALSLLYKHLNKSN